MIGEPRSAGPMAVTYSFACDDTGAVFGVTGFSATEELNRPFKLSLDLHTTDDTLDARELLGRNVHLLLEREAHVRGFAGVVREVTIHADGPPGQASHVEVSPALEGLKLSTQTRIFQGKTVVEILSDVLTAGLAPYAREFDVSSLANDAYPLRDYCVQYRETDFDFVHRLMEEEGIGYFFEFHERERLILFDRVGASSLVSRPAALSTGRCRAWWLVPSRCQEPLDLRAEVDGGKPSTAGSAASAPAILGLRVVFELGS